MAMSGQKVVAAAGTAEALADEGTIIRGGVEVKALTTNTGLVYVGNDGGDVASDTGFVLAAGQSLRLNYVGDLYQVKVDAAVNGEGVCWHRLEVA